MALFRNFFYRKLPEGLLEISERVFVFDCCFTTNVLEDNEYHLCIRGVVDKLRDHFPDASFTVYNFGDEVQQSHISNTLSEYSITVINYPRHYENSPLLNLEMIHDFLRSSENWISNGPRNVLLMHCQRGAFPLLAFMLSAFLIHSKQYNGEEKTLDMIYKHAPREILKSLSPLNPLPSQLRYLQYVSKRNMGSEWTALDRAVKLDSVILRNIPDMDGEGGFLPLFRIHGPDPLMVSDRTAKVIFSMPKTSREVGYFKQAGCELVKIDINCHVQGDIVLECVTLDDSLEHEKMTFRVMFNTAFIRSNILILNRDEIDILWDVKDQFPKDFTAEVIFSEINEAESMTCSPRMLQKDNFSSVSHNAYKVGRFLEVKSEAFENDTISEIPLASSKTSVDLESMTTKIESREVQVSVQRPAQSKIISPRISQNSLSNPASNSISLQGSSLALSRYYSAPSALGITALLHDHAEFSNKEVSSPLTRESSISSLDSCVLKHVQPTNSSMPPPAEQRPPPPLLPPPIRLLTPQPQLQPLPPLPSLVPPPPPPPPPPSRLQPQPPPSTAPPLPPPPAPMQPSIAPPPPPPPSPPMQSSIAPPPPPLQPSIAPPPPPPPPPLQPSIAPPPPPPPPPTPPPLEPSIALPPPPPPPLQPPIAPPSPPPLKPSIAPPPPPPPRRSLETTKPPSLSSVPSSSTICQDSSLLPENNLAKPATPPPPPPPQCSNSVTVSNNKRSPAPPPPPPRTPSSIHKLTPARISQTVPPPPAPLLKGLSNGSSQLHSSLSKENIPLPPSNAKVKLQPRTSTRTQAQTKKTSFKPYHWLKLTRAMQGSLWAEAQKPEEASKSPELDMSELESLFSAVVPNSDHGLSTNGKTNRRCSSGKPDKVNLIELRRAYNCEIMLTKVKVPLSDLMNSVLALDDSALDIDQVDNLIKFCPTKEETELLKNYKGEKENLGKCEQFFMELMKVPRVESKLRVFSFKIQFFSQVSDLRHSLNIVNSVSEEVRNSIKLKRIMQTVLSLGNALNHGTARGSAVGFRLDSLLKLTETRACNNKLTLMHYLCKVLAEKLPEVLDFQKDLASLEAATKIQLKYLAEEMQAISKGLEKVVQELTASENDGPVSEHFCKILKEFFGYADAEVRSLASLYSGVGRNADALALYFGEDPARCPFEQVVSTLLNFVRMFLRAHEENCKQLEFEKKKARKEAENNKVKNEFFQNRSEPNTNKN